MSVLGVGGGGGNGGGGCTAVRCSLVSGMHDLVCLSVCLFLWVLGVCVISSVSVCSCFAGECVYMLSVERVYRCCLRSA